MEKKPKYVVEWSDTTRAARVSLAIFLYKSHRIEKNGQIFMVVLRFRCLEMRSN